MPGKGIVKKDSGKNGGKEQQYEKLNRDNCFHDIFGSLMPWRLWKYRVGRTEFSIGSSGDFDKGELSDGIWL